MIWPFLILYVLIGGIALVFAKVVGIIIVRQAAIAKALFARIPLRDPTEQEIEKAAKEEIDWGPEAERAPQLYPMGRVRNVAIRQRVRDRLYAKQFAPKLD